MTKDKVLSLTSRQKKLAVILFPDVKDYVEKEKDKDIVWCNERELEKAA